MQTPGAFLQTYQDTARKKASNSAGRLFLLAILAGFLIGMGALTSTLLSYSIQNPSLAQLIKGLVFPFGLIIVLYTGAELFTGNILLLLGLFEKNISAKAMLRNWILVYVGNFTGSLILSGTYVLFSGFTSGKAELATTIMRVADSKSALSFSQGLVLGIFCNFLVCMAVMQGLMAKSGAGKALGAFLPVAFFVWAGFEHSVANMYYISAGLFLKNVPALTVAGSDFIHLTWGNFFLKNLLPVTLGNILGGALFAGLIYLAHRPSKKL